MPSALCSICKHGQAFYRRQYEGVNLCRSCFKESVEKKVRRTISNWKMFSPEDHVAVAVSGGKDSLTLLIVLKKLTLRFPRTRITAVTVDEGIESYREEAVKLASDYCQTLGVDHEVISFKELFGSELDTYLKDKKERLTACSYCGVFRRKAINIAARRVGANKIATAHNLDDVLQTYLLNILEGDVERFVRFSPVLQDPRGQFLTRVKPLCEVPEKEVALYGYSDDLKFQSASCPYMGEALRNELRSIFNRLELAHPGVLFSAYHAMLKLRKLAEPGIAPSILQSCERCGEPSVASLCEACRMMGESVLRMNPLPVIQ